MFYFIVVSKERLQAAEREARQSQLDAIDVPMTLEIDSNSYHLIGAVQHTDRPMDDIIDDNIGFGH